MLANFPSKASVTEYDLIVIGAGPAGSSAALYASRSKLRTLVIDKAPRSGALAITHKIANYPGVPGETNGMDLLTQFWQQAQSFGAEIIETPVQAVDLTGQPKLVYTPEETYQARAVIVATGARSRSKKMPGEERFLGRGVSYCGTCDAPFYQNKRVAVIGDTEELVKEGQVLARFASHVDVVVPVSKLTGGYSTSELAALPNVTVYERTKPLEVVGDSKVQGLRVKQPGQDEMILPVDGVFIFLSGSGPSVEFLGDQLQLDTEGYIQPDDTMASSVPGVFVAGDIRNTPVKQAVIAASDGALAAIAADHYLRNRSRLIAQR